MATIKSIHKNYNYVIDTHTAVGANVYDKYIISTQDMTKTIIVSTASPFKFSKSVMEAIYGKEAVKEKSEFTLIEELKEKSGISIPEGLKNLESKEIRFDTICDKEEMKDIVLGNS